MLYHSRRTISVFSGDDIDFLFIKPMEKVTIDQELLIKRLKSIN